MCLSLRCEYCKVKKALSYFEIQIEIIENKNEFVSIRTSIYS